MTFFNVHHAYQPTTLNFPVAWPLIRIVYRISYAVTLEILLPSVYKKGLFLLSETLLKVKWNKTNTDQ